MILCEEKYPKILDEISVNLTKKNIELVFVNSEIMKDINLQNRGFDKTTDVLSFPFIDTPKNNFLGSIVINLDLVDLVAKNLNHSNDDEIALLFIHGLLHLLGFDHEKDDGEMREKECKLIQKFSLPKSLIVRTCD